MSQFTVKVNGQEIDLLTKEAHSLFLDKMISASSGNASPSVESQLPVVDTGAFKIPDGYKEIGKTNEIRNYHGRTYPSGSPVFSKKTAQGNINHLVVSSDGNAKVARKYVDLLMGVSITAPEVVNQQTDKTQSNGFLQLVIAGNKLNCRTIFVTTARGTEGTAILFEDNIKLHSDSEAIRGSLKAAGFWYNGRIRADHSSYAKSAYWLNTRLEDIAAVQKILS